MEHIEYQKARKIALRFIYNNRNCSIESFLTNCDEQFLKEFESMGFIEIDRTNNSYELLRLGKDYVDEFYN